MKKFMQTMLAIALTATTIAPMSAFAATSTEWKVGDGSEVDGVTVTDEEKYYVVDEPSGTDLTTLTVANTNGGTKLSLGVDNYYMVIIPSQIVLKDDGNSDGTSSDEVEGDKQYTGKGTVKIEDAVIPVDNQIKITPATKDDALEVKNDTTFSSGTFDTTISYTVYKSSIDNSNKVTESSEILTLHTEKGKTRAEETLYFKTNKDEVVYAGSYNGTYDFNVSVVEYK